MNLVILSVTKNPVGLGIESLIRFIIFSTGYFAITLCVFAQYDAILFTLITTIISASSRFDNASSQFNYVSSQFNCLSS